MEFKDILKDLRTKNNLSQQALADAIYVSRSAVAKWENGLGLPNEDSIEQLMKYFNVDHDYLFPKIKQEDLVMKNVKIRRFKVGYLIGCIVVFLVASIVSIVIVKANANNDNPSDVGIKISDDQYNYDLSQYEIKEEENIKYIVDNNEVIIVGYNEDQGNDIVIKNSYEGYTTTQICANAFRGCKNLISVVMPKTIKRIGNSAFSDCENLTSVTIAKDVKSRIRLSSTCFWFKVAPITETSIDSGAFSGCSKLVNLELPEATTIIGYSVFKDCTSLESITIPESVKSIYYEAFENCISLKSIYIPKNVTYISEGIFANCQNLESIVVDSENTIYDSRDNCNAIITTENNELVHGCKNTIIPNSVTSIASCAFEECITLTSIEIPTSVTSIENRAFTGCTNLTSVIFNGTKEQWKLITKKNNWNENTGNYTIHCTDGEITK